MPHAPHTARPHDGWGDDDIGVGFAPRCDACLSLLVPRGPAHRAHWGCADCGRLRVS